MSAFSAIKERADSSRLSLNLSRLIYLNDGFEGGTTDFQFGPTVVPQRGMLLLFEHSLVHQGAPVRGGCKYVLRTDVMFRP